MPDVGSSSRLRVSFADSTGAAVDPATVLLRTRSPDPGAVETTYTYGVDDGLVRAGIGRYYFDLVLTRAGVWAIRWIGQSELVAATEVSIPVKASRFTVP